MLKRSYAQLATASSSYAPSACNNAYYGYDSSTTTSTAATTNRVGNSRKMKTLQISNANVSTLGRSSSTSSLRRSSSGVETVKKLKKYSSDSAEASAVDEEQQRSSAGDIEFVDEPQDDSRPKATPAATKKEELLLLADEEECAPGATKSNDSAPTAEAAASEADVPIVHDVAPAIKVVEVPRELAKESEDERECYRHAIVDVPALVELLTLIGRCPVCKSPLRTDKIATDEQTAVVNVSLRCARPRCQFTKHWCSSPTAGITDNATK